MYTRVITYDLKNASQEDYQSLYDYLESVNAQKITESSYLIKTDFEWADFKQQVKSVTKDGDNVKAVVICDKTIKVWTIR